MSFQGLSNGTSLMQIQSGRMVPLISYLKKVNEWQRWTNTQESFLRVKRTHWIPGSVWDASVWAAARRAKNLQSIIASFFYLYSIISQI